MFTGIASAYRPEGDLIFTDTNRDFLSSPEKLAKAMTEGRILEAPVTRCSNSLDLTVELAASGLTGVIVKNEITFEPDGGPVKDIAAITRVGKPVCFKVTRIENKVAYLSRREAQREAYANYLSGLNPGDIIPAKVTHLEHFGAFVDIGCGMVSLLPIDCVSVSRISHPADRLSVGTEFLTVVRGIERGAEGLPMRFFVSRKELLGTWEQNAALFDVGQTVTGIVRSVESYGVFIELTPNLAGLAEYRSDVTQGQAAAVYIKSLIPEKMKVKLVIVDPYRGIPPKPLPHSFLPEDTLHIHRWRYSPDCCDRVVESVFDKNEE